MKGNEVMKNRNNVIATTLLTFGIIALSPIAQAVSPPPDGGYPGGNTAEGQNALGNSAIGGYNTAIGFLSLASLTDASFNTGVGAGTLLANIGPENTATGAGALLSNTTGADNTADGVFALSSNTDGHDNAAIGDYALFSNTSGSNNTAMGRVSLYSNTIGDNNTAVGSFAGHDLTTGDNNIDIGYNVVGVAGESNTIRIGNMDIADTFVRGISGTTIASGDPVLVAANGHLGTLTSSKRFKEEVKPMDKASEALFSLKPVTFRYKKEIDPVGTSQFGLIAEDVEEVNPDLVTRDENGKVNSVRYDKVNVMLLNEFLKEHCKVEEQEATIAQQQEDFQATTARLEAIVAQQQQDIKSLTASLKEQAAQIQKVSAQIELRKPRASTVANNQ
jgi:hypothetical protein